MGAMCISSAGRKGDGRINWLLLGGRSGGKVRAPTLPRRTEAQRE